MRARSKAGEPPRVESTSGKGHSSITRREWRRIAVRAAFFVAVVQIAEYAVVERFLSVPDDRVAVLALEYQQLVTMTRRPYPRFTTAIEFQKAARVTPRTIDGGVCGFRKYVGEVLQALNAYGPRAVVLDIALDGRNKCDAETAFLQEAAHAACRSYPVILAYGVDPETWTRVDGPGIGHRDFCEESPDSAFDDLRRVPIAFLVKQSPDQPVTPQASLALIAAAMVEPAVPERHPVDNARNTGEQLFASMIRAEDWVQGQSRIPAQVIVAPNTVPGAPDPRLIPWLRGRVLLLGSDEEQRYDTVSGKMHGFLIQANYIEALLDGRLFWQVSKWWQILIGFVFWLGLELVNHILDHMWGHRHHWLLGLLWSFSTFVCMLLLLVAADGLLAAFLGGFGDFATISVIGTFLFLVIELDRRLTERKRSKLESEAK